MGTGGAMTDLNAVERQRWGGPSPFAGKDSRMPSQRTDMGLRRVSFTVAGLPAPQGSKKAIPNRHTGRMIVLEQSGAKLKDWRDAVNAAAWQAVYANPPAAREVFRGPVGVSLAFTLPRPASAPRGRSWPCVRPDLDKLVRAVLDAITGPVLADDGQVIWLHATKGYPGGWVLGPADPGVFVEVHQLDRGEGSRCLIS
jgi:crossover junction endodeoxyribonuclease RusA